MICSCGPQQYAIFICNIEIGIGEPINYSVPIWHFILSDKEETVVYCFEREAREQKEAYTVSQAVWSMIKEDGGKITLGKTLQHPRSNTKLSITAINLSKECKAQ